MRPQAALLVALLVAAPTVGAAGFTLGAARQMEAALDEDGVATFTMPLRIDANGSVYAKLLATGDNAALDEPGWSVAFELALGDARTPMGVADGSAATRLVEVRERDAGAFVVRAKPPPSHAPDPTLYVALAFRPLTKASGGLDDASGASPEEARALTLAIRTRDGAVQPPPGEEEEAPTIPPVGPIAAPPDGPAPQGALASRLATPLYVLAAAIASLAAAVGAHAAVLVALRRRARPTVRAQVEEPAPEELGRGR